ncbi:MAG: Gfo/Idh/MocA family oxidoreductase [SAR324 cluster bacterium]|nr:Gfo/Idh/MocA family oxidoreductase [SAR324 cluster bacterium]
MPSVLRTAVIGVGYLGRFHAQKYAQLDQCELVGVVDQDFDKAEVVGDELSVAAYRNYEELLGKVDAVSIVVPTIHHYQLAKSFIEQGVHVLVEKPFTASLEQAKELVELSRQRQTCLQVGHLERFNVVFSEFQSLIDRPQFIDCTRISPFPKRGTDVDVILDLMIHDIDLVLALLGEYPEAIEGVGTSVLTTKVDLANARLTFPSGCVVNLTASRVSDKAERKMRIFQSGLYLSLDYGTGRARKLQVDPAASISSDDLIPTTLQLEKNDALLEEIQSFLSTISHQSVPLVTAEDGLQAMELAWLIKEQIQQ